MLASCLLHAAVQEALLYLLGSVVFALGTIIWDPKSHQLGVPFGTGGRAQDQDSYYLSSSQGFDYSVWSTLFLRISLRTTLALVIR